MGRQVGGGFRIGNSCTPVVDSCQCMAKPIEYYKIKKKDLCFLKINFLFDDLSFGISRVLMSPTIIVLLLISPFMSVSACLMY